MQSDSKEQRLVSLVPEGGEHKVSGERKYVFPGIQLEILTTRQIELKEWRLRGLNDPFWRLYIPVEGSAFIAVEHEGEKIAQEDLSPGSAYLIPPHTTIHSKINHHFVKWYVHFSLGQRGDRAIPGVYRVEFTDGMEQSIERISQLDVPDYTWSSARLVGEALEQLPLEIWTKRNLDLRIEAAMNFIYRNFSRNLCSEEIAAVSGVSVRTLHHLFRQHLGATPKNVHMEFRINEACRLLRHTDSSIEQIAEVCGFPNRYYFSRVMKQVRSISPAAYRKVS